MSVADAGPAPDDNPSPAGKPDRLEAMDTVRGAVMALMAVDHTRDYFSHETFDPTDPDKTTVALFLTRWVTHFCAPAFFLLAGIGVSLALAGGRRSPLRMSRYLAVRGLFLIAVDLTLIRVGWDMNFDFFLHPAKEGPWFIVLSTLGAGMVLLAGLIHLPRWAVGVFAVALIAGHNWFDGVRAEDFGPVRGPLWAVLHVRGEHTLAGFPFEVTYPLVPWVGVMAAGFVLGPVMRWDRPDRRRALLVIGLGLVAAFLVLRATGSYGDPRPWAPRYGDERDVLAFLRTEKYPSSLQYLLMTLGPVLVALAALDGWKGPVTRRFMTLGRVPFFFYVAHLYLIHGLAVVLGASLGTQPWTAYCVVYGDLPKDWGFPLWEVYIVWGLILATLYPVCAWFSGLKKRSQARWLSYL